MINEVEGFDPAALARTAVADDGSVSTYLDVKYRVLWFRLRFPNGKLETEVLKVTDQFAIVGCKVYADKADPPEQFIAKAVAQRFVAQVAFGERFLEVAETAAIGRALAYAGFGTQACWAGDSNLDRADAPVQVEEQEMEEESAAGEGELLQERPPQAAEAVCLPAESAASTAAAPDRSAQSAPGGAMTVEQAKAVVVDFGRYKGTTLGQIALSNPPDLKWYIDHYTGPNQAVKMGADVLVRAARAAAC